MNHVDLSVLSRNAVGFDRLFKTIGTITAEAAKVSYPPYDILRLGEDEFRISIAVAGFGQEEIAIEAHDGALTIKGQREDKQEADYVYRGIANRSFERRFQLADHVEVTGASLENGLLSIELVRRVPDEKKPRKIDITSGVKVHDQAAA